MYEEPYTQDGEIETPATLEEQLKRDYGAVYRVGVVIEVDDDNSLDKEYYFKKPSTASYDRYIKTASQSPTKSLKVFLLDNVTRESASALTADIEGYPALALSIGEKLLAMLGLSKQTNLKLL